MLNRDYLERIKRDSGSYEAGRRETIRLSDDIRTVSKRAIFAMHRDDTATADRLLAEALKGIVSVHAKSQDGLQLTEEGSFRAALEEYVEARLYRDVLDGKELGPVNVADVEVPPNIFLGGLCDMVGELQRRQVRLATDGDIDGVKAMRDLAEELVGALLEMDLTGYLRNKFDQVKNSFRRSEEILYELSVRRT
ncbi:hypothetical protein COY93_02985 [Candidatus Uhrbacteria bacterium CG_4_10_14_0_8_um_filter_58_22]|uniref:Translin n=1 Tax=Candidatus Uhrbacteria bacterium CG_4_10_14_0_8_um_filter_58_22 TaxID=1975029 RepID=A0A2M7Q9N2_9BACT|nr:MAG: hypothetical protein AUJ19_02865 [Parcubacteria group bacterium CG1_02_58_44]PIY62461.1 MAG: hypothetical protein COY93_02985 [Candidatus Uhrbacteria bacterium CG_4_10_14_0_8_um_filter_58_22]